MSRVTSIRLAFLVVVAGSVLAFSASPARAATLCVGPGAGCFGTIQAAVNAANNGDTITIAAGTYAGGIQINVSVSLVGAGAKQTTISGGSPVVLIGAPFPWPTNPATVSITGVTIRNGVNTSFPDPPVAQGGGVIITPARNPVPNEPGVTGAKVTVTDSVITHNRVYATDQIPPGFCGPLSCAFADGGGIDNSGDLTLVNTQVTDNDAVSPPGVATGVGDGGIANHPQGVLLVRRSVISDNHARGDAPDARSAGSGGIGGDGTLTIESSLVSGNTVELSGQIPSDNSDGASAGGITVGDGGGTITNTLILGNQVTASNVGDDMFAYGGGIVAFGPLTLQGGKVNDNSVDTTSAGGAALDDGGGLEVDGLATITDTMIKDNTVNATASGNTAVAQGGGLANAGQTTVRRTLVVGNSVHASGGSGVAQGGGIWNGTFGDAPPALSLIDSAVLRNSASGSPGIDVEGGGVYSDFPLTVMNTLIAGNTPDQCFGC